MKTKKVCALAGDGIGREIMGVGLALFESVAKELDIQYELTRGLVGWSAYDKYGDVMPPETWKLFHEADAVVLGAVGLPLRNKGVENELMPEIRALLAMRQVGEFGCNIRPIKVLKDLAGLSPLQPHIVGEGINLTFFRELLGGDYFGAHETDRDGLWAKDNSLYTKVQIESIARAAFEMARSTGQSVTSVDKANVLASVGSFWRKVVTDLHEREFPEVTLRHQYVDSMNLMLFTKPSEFEIILTSNGYGDILSDGAAGLAGSMGLLPSASLNTTNGRALYEPSGGSAPDIAGKGVANPVAMILSVSLMFRHTFGNEVAVKAIEDSVTETLVNFRTPDIAKDKNFKENIVSTDEFGSLVIQRTLQKLHDAAL